MTVLNILGVVFVALKLTHYIDWSWWWVTAPFWVAATAWAGVVLVGLWVLINSGSPQ